MSLLFYLNQQNNKKGVDDFLIFLTEFTVQSRKEVIVLCESDFDFNVLESQSDIAIKHTIINLYSNGNFSKETKNSSKLEFDSKYLYNIEKKRFNNHRSVSKKLEKIVYILEDIIIKYTVEACHFTPIGGIYRSVGMVILQDLLYKKSIKSYMVFSTPIKGRFMIYDDIYLKNKKFEHTYNSLINDGINKIDITKINKYFNDYFKFKRKWHLPFLIKRREKQELNELLNKNILKKIIKLIRQGFIPTKLKSRDSNRPYILFLLSKNNQWFSSFANPELLNRIQLIEKIYTCLPKGYDLVLKSHPHISKDISIQKITRKLIDCYCYYDNPSTHDLVSGASLVISAGTTAGVEALMQNKHVIELGDRPPYFNFDKPPVKRVGELDMLKNIILECLDKKPLVDNINSYFLALIQCSYSLSDNDNEITLERRKSFYKKAAQVLFDRMAEDTITFNVFNDK